ncbi:glyoxalase superfamily protein [Shinella zoogloeoides]
MGEGVGNAGTDEDFAGTEGTDMRDFRDAKAMAKAMRETLAARNIEISHSEALEIVARQFGVETWNILSSKIEAKPQEGGIAFKQAVPIVRIFDVAKAHEFYLGFLGFSVDWEHRYGENFPLYTQVSRGGLRLHLSEHAGDATPGGNMVVYMTGIRAFQKELIGKDYRYMKPGLEDEGSRLEVTVTDPFQNRIRFMELKG